MNVRETLKANFEPIYRSLYFPPAVICVAILAATVFGWQEAQKSLDQDVMSAVNSRIKTTEQSIRTHMDSYEEILRGGVGLFKGSNEVTREDWKNYIEAFDVSNKYQGVQGIGYAKVISAADVMAVTAYMRAQGVSDFSISPASPARDIYAAVLYLETIAAKNTPAAFGFDMYSEPTRQEAMLRAQDTMQPTITNRINLITTDTNDPSSGFNMYLPYYTPGRPTETAAQREAAIGGYVYAAFRANVFFKEVSQSADSDMAAFRIAVEGDMPGTNLYISDSFNKVNAEPGMVSFSRPFTIYSQTWNVQYVFDRHGLVSDEQLRRPASIIFAGLFAAFLIAMIVLLLLRARAHELTTQKERAVELAKDELLSLASHQLRTPATGVKQYVGMVLQGFTGDLTEEQRALLEKAYASNDRQLGIINEILHLAKIDAGRMIPARQETTIGELLTDVINEQRPDIEAAGHTLTLKLTKRPIILNIDAHMLRMAIENILSNAIKYTPPKGAISVRLYKDDSQAYIRIQDTGVGIEQGDVDKLFKQFSRLPNEMSQRVGGTGVGLYLAKHLVELQDGYIVVRSRPGKGSAFTITLPLTKRIENV